VEIALGSKGGSQTFQSPGFPDPLPPNQVLTYEIKAEPGNKVAVMCMSVEIVEDPSCESQFVIEENGKKEVNCKSVKYFDHNSKSDRLVVILKSGPKGGANLNCMAQALKPASAGPVVKDIGELMFSKETEEVDSSEFGVVPGKKSTTCKCGWANEKSAQRIIGGKEVEKHKYPFIVTVVFSGTKMPFCGGSILTPYHVLTAAHCTHKYLNRSLSVVIGEHNYKVAVSNARFVRIDKIYEHENYNDRTLQDDLSIMLTARKIPFTDLVGPVCLPSKPIDVTKQQVKLLGWGRPTEFGSVSDYLKEANFRVTDDKWCHHFYSVFIPKGATNSLCIYGRNRGGCRGDSGGPVVWLDPETNRYTLVGVVSMTWTCGQRDPLVNAKVSSYLDWINKKIEDTNPEGKACTKTG